MQVVNLNNLNDSSPVTFKSKIWLKIYEQKRRMKINHNSADIPYLERRGAVVGTTLRHYTLAKKVKESTLQEEDRKSDQVRKCLDAPRYAFLALP